MASNEAKKETNKKYLKDRADDYMAKIIVDQEYVLGETNRQEKKQELEDAIDMLECVKTDTPKEDWQSNIMIPEFASMILTLAGVHASQYFQRRDFVETYLEGNSEEAILAANAAERCLNRTLNQRHLFFYHKFMRADQLSNLGGENFLKCWWEQRVEKRFVDYETGEDEYGNTYDEPIYEDEITLDRFNFDVLDPRNVVTSDEYTYTLQDKDWVIVREEKTFAELEAEADIMGYTELDKLREKLKNFGTSPETETAQKTYNKDINKTPISTGLFDRFDVLWRWGKWPCHVTERDEEGNPLKIKSALGAYGQVEDGAQWLETVIVYAVSGSIRQRIRMDVNPYGFKPIIRGLCYIHPTKDGGLGDGKLAKELQDALNETLNLSNDNVLLSTFPTFTYRMFSALDPEELYFAPGHALPLENPDDFKEIRITTDIQGALAQASLFKDGLQKLMAVYPTTMGALPEYSSTTATAVVESGRNADTRGNYRALTAEYTWLTELYWMILKMTDMFALPETREKLMGELEEYFDADYDYTFKPVSQAIETEYSRRAKIRELTTLLQMVASFPNPQTPKVMNKIIKMIFELQGHEMQAIGELLDENTPPQMPGMGTTPPGVGGIAPEVSNQYGLPTGPGEQMAREGTYGF